MSTTLPATAHRCGKCKQPNYIPTLAVVVTVEVEPPKRGDPIPDAVDGSLRNCHHCGARVIPRFATVNADAEPIEPPPPPKRGEPVPDAPSAAAPSTETTTAPAARKLAAPQRAAARRKAS